MDILMYIQIIVSLILVVSVTLQARGSQLGMAFGGSGENYRSKRGLEVVLYYTTIVASVIFAAVSILSLLPNLSRI